MRLVAFIVGVGFGALGLWAVYPILYPPTVPAGYHNLSAIPDDIAAKFEDPEFLDRIVKQERQLEDLRAEMAATPVVSLPDSVAPFPFGSIYAPKDTTHWPVLSDDTANAVLEAAKTDWVILNIWATWCAPCIKELPDMQAANPMLQESGVNADPTRKDTQAVVDAIFAERGSTSLSSVVTAGPDIQAILAATGQEQVAFPTNLIFAPGGEPFG